MQLNIRFATILDEDDDDEDVIHSWGEQERQYRKTCNSCWQTHCLSTLILPLLPTLSWSLLSSLLLLITIIYHKILLLLSLLLSTLWSTWILVYPTPIQHQQVRKPIQFKCDKCASSALRAIRQWSNVIRAAINNKRYSKDVQMQLIIKDVINM